MDTFIAFAGVAALMTISPGPDMAVMLRNVLRAGPSVVLPTALGIVTGLAGWAVASALGISALVAASESAYSAFRLAGAAYLAALGLVALRHAATRAPAERGTPSDAPAGRALAGRALAGRAPMGFAAAYRVGLVTNLTNPKVGVFYATLLPQFIPPSAPVLGTSLVLAGIHAALGVAWLTAYGRALDRLAGTLVRGPGRRILEAATGIVLLAVGARVATDA